MCTSTCGASHSIRATSILLVTTRKPSWARRASATNCTVLPMPMKTVEPGSMAAAIRAAMRRLAALLRAARALIEMLRLSTGASTPPWKRRA
ncbi:hypothetical protein D3C87_1645010 [compost metagenome]